jgi:hypothetical protein
MASQPTVAMNCRNALGPPFGHRTDIARKPSVSWS